VHFSGQPHHADESQGRTVLFHPHSSSRALDAVWMPSFK
jgi:hypothetical protein